MSAAQPRTKLPAFRLRVARTAEDDLHVSVASAMDRLLLPPAMWTCFPAGNVPLPPQFAAKLARMGLKRGWPDILISYQHVYGIELKGTDGVLSKTRIARTRNGSLRVLEGQMDVFPRLIASGGIRDIHICRSVDDVLASLRQWGVPTRMAAA